MKSIGLIIVALLSLGVHGQKDILDKNKLLVDSLFYDAPNKALEICENSIPISINSNDTMMISYFLDQSGELNRMLGNYDLAVEQLHKCLQFKQNWQDLKDLSITHNNLGKTYGQQGQYKLSVKHFIYALKLMEEDNNLLGQSFYLNNLAAIYDLQHNYHEAINYYEQSLAIKEELGDKKGIAASNTNLGISYFHLNELDKAIMYHTKAYEIYLELKDTTRLSRTMSNMGRTYIELEEYNLAHDILLDANKMEAAITDQKLKMDLYNNIGLVYIQTGELDSARHYLTMAEEMGLSAGAWSILVSNYQTHSILEEKTGNLGLALDYLKKSMQYNDSLINEANINAVAEMRGKYEHEKNMRLISESELANAKKQRLIEEQKYGLLLWSSIAITGLLLIILFLFLYLNKRKNHNLLQGQLSLIKTKNELLAQINKEVKDELNKTQISLEEKEAVLSNVFEKSKNIELPPELLALSKRELEVLSYLALGWSDEQLANKLFVSKSTIKTHLRRIYSKLLVRGRAEAVNIAHKYNIIGNEL